MKKTHWEVHITSLFLDCFWHCGSDIYMSMYCVNQMTAMALKLPLETCKDYDLFIKVYNNSNMLIYNILWIKTEIVLNNEEVL